jgi:hypothetical protein
MMRASRPFIDSKIRKFASISCNLCFTSWSFLGIEEEEDDAAARLAVKSDLSFIISTIWDCVERKDKDEDKGKVSLVILL